MFCLFPAAQTGPLASSVTSTIYKEGLRKRLPFLPMYFIDSYLLMSQVNLHSRKSFRIENETKCPFEELPGILLLIVCLECINHGIHKEYICTGSQELL